MEINNEESMAGLLVLILLILLILAIIIDRRRWKQFVSTTFKVAKISDNLGNSSFKIVGKDSNGNFQELIDFTVFNTSIIYNIPSRVKEPAGQSFLSIEVAEKELNNFLIYIGQVKYKKEIVIFDNEKKQAIL